MIFTWKSSKKGCRVCIWSTLISVVWPFVFHMNTIETMILSLLITWLYKTKNTHTLLIFIMHMIIKTMIS